MSSATIARADKLMKTGDGHSKTSLFKWKANWDEAADAYKEAAKLYDRENAHDKAAIAHQKESHAFYKAGIYYHAATAKVAEARSWQELKTYDKMIEAYDEASTIFLEDGKADRAGEALEKCAKALKKSLPGEEHKKPRRFKRKKKDDAMAEDDGILDPPPVIDKIHESLKDKELFFKKDSKSKEVKVTKNGKESYTYTEQGKPNPIEIWGTNKEQNIYFYDGKQKVWPFLLKATMYCFEKALNIYVEGDQSHLSRQTFDEYTTFLIRIHDFKAAIKNIYALIPAVIALDMPHRVLECQIAIILMHISIGDFDGAFAAEQEFAANTNYTYAGSEKEEVVRQIYEAIAEEDQEAFDKLQKNKHIRFLMNELKNRIARIRMNEELASAYANATKSRPSANNEKLNNLLGDSDEEIDEMDEEDLRQRHPLNEKEKEIQELEQEDDMEDDDDDMEDTDSEEI